MYVPPQFHANFCLLMLSHICSSLLCILTLSPFQKHEANEFFLHFEKVTANLHWLSEIKAMLLQSVLIGKACEVYSALSVEQGSDYSLVKSEILSAYELIPQAHRQKFRDTKCPEVQTYTEFARKKFCSISSVPPNK